MVDRLPLDALRALLEIQSSGNFTSAAKNLGRTQAALSLQIKKLEELVGEMLIDRTSRPVSLTAKGQLLAGYAHQMMALEAACLSELRGADLEGRLRIGLPNDLAIGYLPHVLGRFARDNPKISLDVASELSRGLTSRRDSSHFDLILAIHDPDSNLRPVRRWRDPVEWVVPADLDEEVAQQEPLRLVLYPDGCHYRSRVISTLTANGIGYRICYSGASLSGIQAAVESGLGVTALSNHTIPKLLVPLRRDKGLPDLGSIEIALYHPKEDLSLAGRRLSGFLMQVLDEQLSVIE